MSRPSGGASTSRPSIGGGGSSFNGPNVSLPSNRPNIGNSHLGNSRPGLPTTLPGAGGARPNLPTTRPGTDANRPDFASRPGQLPSAPSYNRPSQGQLQGFLDLPGGPSQRPSTLPAVGARPGIADRPNVGNLPNVGERPKIGGGNNLGNNVGNDITINRQNNINSMRNHWNGVTNRPFDQNWWGHHPANGAHWHWHAHWGGYGHYWCWRPCTWVAIGSWLPWAWSQPINYDYGNTVVYRDNYVYVDNQQVATSEDYYQQADTIAASVPEQVDEDKVEWMPLGVFAVSEENATDSGMLLQLAVSKEGILAGTFYNEVTDSSRPVEGTVDQKTQRAAWKFADDKNPEVVMETGIYNLTEDQATALVHFGSEKTQTWLLVRLPAPADDAENN